MYRSSASLAAARRLVARSAVVVPCRAPMAAAVVARTATAASAVGIMRPLLACGFHSSVLRSGGAGGDSAAPGSTVPFLLADIGEGITECEITQWFVKEGDAISQFEKICEVQSDKAAVEISSRFDGTITKLHYKIGDMAKVGAPLIDIKLDGDAPADAAESTPAAAPAQPTAAPPAPSTPSAPAASSPTPSTAHSAASSDRLVFATPAVRRIAREHSIDLRQVPATGKGDRILKEDVLRFIETGGKVAAASTTTAPTTSTAPITSPAAPTPAAGDELRALTTIQKAMFKSMSKSLTIPHFGYSDELRLDAIMKVRDAVNRSVKAAPKGTYPFSKVSYMPFFIKSFSLALQQFPLLNSQLVLDASLPADQAVSSAKLLYRTRHNVSIAMDTPAGLIVPNIKDVQSKSIFDIAADLHRLQEAGKKGAIPAADLKDGTITLSNIGAIGGTYMGPVVVTSEVCIAALGKTQRLPRYKNDESTELEPHHIMPVSFSADHRVVDGASVARFVQVWKQYLENPMAMLAAMK